jgi:hypothetical protein
MEKQIEKLLEDIAADYKAWQGVGGRQRDDLIYMTQRKPAEFLEIVCEYVERECV